MILSTSSNVVSAVYLIFCLLYQVLFVSLLKLLGSNWNLYWIYGKRQLLLLRSTRAAVSLHQGQTKRWLGRLLATVAICSVGLILGGSFSIDGFSKTMIEQRMGQAVVDWPNADAEVTDFQLHYKLDDSGSPLQTGASILAEYTSTCYATNGSILKQYSSVFTNNDFDLSGWYNTSEVNRFPWKDVKCRTESSGMEEAVAYTSERVTNVNVPESCRFISIDPNTTADLAPALSMTIGCPEFFDVVEAWCCSLFKKPTVNCVTLLLMQPKDVYMLLQITLSPTGSFAISALDAYHRKPHSAMIRSMAYIANFKGNVESADWISMLSIRNNITVGVQSEVKKMTKINVVLLASTFGSALLILAVLTVASLLSWIYNVKLPNRQNYNPFYSSSDILSCLVSEKTRRGDSRFKNNESIWVGMDAENDGGLVVTPLGKDEKY